MKKKRVEMGGEKEGVAATMHKKGVSHVNYTIASPLHINLPNIHIII